MMATRQLRSLAAVGFFFVAAAGPDCESVRVIFATLSNFLRARLSGELILLLPVAIPLQGSCDMMKSPVVKRSIVLAGHKTSVSLEDTFWEALREIARQRRMTVSDLVSSINLQHAD